MTTSPAAAGANRYSNPAAAAAKRQRDEELIDKALAEVNDGPIIPGVTADDIKRLVGSDKIDFVSQQAFSGRQARSYVRVTERRVTTLSTFCEAVFRSYLPKEMQTEALGEVFHTNYHKLEPEMRIAMYEKWLADLPYHKFSHLTTMVIDTRNERQAPVLPQAIDKFSHLTRLEFSPTLLAIPRRITKLPNLTTLDLRYYSGNDLDDLLDVCDNLPLLREIILSEHFQGTEYVEALQNEFLQIKIVFQKTPPAIESPDLKQQNSPI